MAPLVKSLLHAVFLFLLLWIGAGSVCPVVTPWDVMVYVMTLWDVMVYVVTLWDVMVYVVTLWDVMVYVAFNISYQ